MRRCRVRVVRGRRLQMMQFVAPCGVVLADRYRTILGVVRGGASAGLFDALPGLVGQGLDRFGSHVVECSTCVIHSSFWRKGS